MQISKRTLNTFRKIIKVIVTFTTMFAFLAQPFMNLSTAAVSAQPLYVPTPTVSLDVAGQVLIGENFSFTVTFDNSSSDIGYGPYIDLYLPQSGADDSADGEKEDGITYTSVGLFGQRYPHLGVQLRGKRHHHPSTYRFKRKLPGRAGRYPVPVYLAAGRDRVALRQFRKRPTKMFVVDVNAALSDYADTDVDLPILAQSGFRFGADALDNPSTDPPHQSAPRSALPSHPPC